MRVDTNKSQYQNHLKLGWADQHQGKSNSENIASSHGFKRNSMNKTNFITENLEDRLLQTNRSEEEAHNHVKISKTMYFQLQQPTELAHAFSTLKGTFVCMHVPVMTRAKNGDILSFHSPSP